MNRKPFLVALAELIAAYRPHLARPRWLRGWLPSRGNVIFTLVIAGLLVLAQTVGALPSSVTQHAPRSTSTSTIAYQGRLADAAGNPLTGTYNMIFRLYDAGTGGAPLWEEQWTGSNGVKVSDGLFNVMLGSLSPISSSLVASHSSLFLGITVGTDDEMAPRVQLGSVPFAVQALTVPEGSVTTGKIADGAVTQAKLGADVSLTPPDGSITTAKIADGAVISRKFKPTYLEAYQQSEVTVSDWTTLHDGGIGVTGTAEVDSYAIVTFSTIAYNEHDHAGAGIGLSVNGAQIGYNETDMRQLDGGFWYMMPLVLHRIVFVPAGSFEIRGMIQTSDQGTAYFGHRRLSVLLVAK